MGKTAERIVTFVPEEYPITLDEAWSKALGSAGRPKTMNVWLDSLPTSAFQGIGRRLSITREKTTWLLPSYQDSRTRRALAVAVDMMPTTHLGLKVDSDPDGTRVTLAVRS